MKKTTILLISLATIISATNLIANYFKPKYKYTATYCENGAMVTIGSNSPDGGWVQIINENTGKACKGSWCNLKNNNTGNISNCGSNIVSTDSDKLSREKKVYLK